MIKLPENCCITYSMLSLIPTHKLVTRRSDLGMGQPRSQGRGPKELPHCLFGTRTLGRIYSQDLEKELGTIRGPGGYKEAAQPRELERKGRMGKEKDD